MRKIPVTELAAVVRTDFASADRWTKLRKTVETPPDPFMANLAFVDDAAFKGKKLKEILAALPKEYSHAFIVIADERALREEGFPCLVVDLLEKEGRSFRALGREIASIENNLSLANMDFEEFADGVGADGVFRGF